MTAESIDDHDAQVDAARQWLKEHGLSRDDQILALNRQGFSQRVIAEAVECDQKTVSNVLRNFSSNGEPVRKDSRGGARPHDHEPEDDQEDLDAEVIDINGERQVPTPEKPAKSRPGANRVTDNRRLTVERRTE